MKPDILITQDSNLIFIHYMYSQAAQLLKTLLAIPLSNKEYIDDFLKALSLGIQTAQDATHGNHKTAKVSLFTTTLTVVEITHYINSCRNYSPH